MNAVTVFTAPTGMNIRVVGIDGNPWFINVDVGRAIGIAKPDRAAAALLPDEKGSHRMRTPGGMQHDHHQRERPL